MDALKNLLQVYKFDKKIRIGLNGDCGYVIGDIDCAYDCYISAGVSTEDSVSVDFIKKYNMTSQNAFAFDGTVSSYPHNIDNITFIKKNINTYNDESNTDLVFLANKFNNIFLKMDIEGWEYLWLLNLDSSLIKNFKQIAIEFHGITGDDWGANNNDKLKCLRLLNNTHYIIHAHGNNYGTVKDGIPDTIELTYLNKNCFDSIPEFNTTKLPIPSLDYRNSLLYPEILLDIYPFVNNIINVFTGVYENRTWDGDICSDFSGSSGPGSSLEANINTYIPFLQEFITDKNITSIIDLGCGDFRCGPSIYDNLNISYTGYDAYKKLIDYNKSKYDPGKYSFINLDFLNTKDEIISGDLCILKDVIQHWPLELIYTFLDYIVSSKKFKYIILVNSSNQLSDNTDIAFGDFRPLSSEYLPIKKYKFISLYNYSDKEVCYLKLE
jgi:hypothetical protein